MPTSGTLHIDGKEISRFPDDELSRFRRDRLGFIFQFFNLLPTLTAVENVILPELLAGKHRDALEPKARALLEQFGLKGAAHPPARRAVGRRDAAGGGGPRAAFRAGAPAGRTQEWLDAKLVLDEAVVPGKPGMAEGRIARHLGWSHAARKSDDLIRKTVGWTWKVKLSLSLERDLFSRLREDAEGVAIKVFADNLRDLLLAAPAGKRVVMGLDPGIRTGVKVAVVSDTGKVLATDTVYPHEPRCDWEGSLHSLGRHVAMHGVNLIAIGNVFDT